METSQNQKWVTGSFMAVAALIGYIVFVALAKLSGWADWEASVRNIDLIIRLSSIGIAAVLFFGLLFNHTANQFMHEVVVELARVTWPLSSETARATVVVVIMVLISGIILGFLDYFWTKVIALVL